MHVLHAQRQLATAAVGVHRVRRDGDPDAAARSARVARSGGAVIALPRGLPAPRRGRRSESRVNAVGLDVQRAHGVGPLGAVETTRVARSRSGSTASRAAATWAGGAIGAPDRGGAGLDLGTVRPVGLGDRRQLGAEHQERRGHAQHREQQPGAATTGDEYAGEGPGGVPAGEPAHRQPAGRPGQRPDQQDAGGDRQQDGASRTSAESSDDCSPTISPHTAAVIRAPSISSRESPGPADRGPVERSSAGTGSRTTGRAISTSSRIAASTASPSDDQDPDRWRERGRSGEPEGARERGGAEAARDPQRRSGDVRPRSTAPPASAPATRSCGRAAGSGPPRVVVGSARR